MFGLHTMLIEWECVSVYMALSGNAADSVLGY